MRNRLTGEYRFSNDALSNLRPTLHRRYFQRLFADNSTKKWALDGPGDRPRSPRIFATTYLLSVYSTNRTRNDHTTVIYTPKYIESM